MLRVWLLTVLKETYSSEPISRCESSLASRRRIVDLPLAQLDVDGQHRRRRRPSELQRALRPREKLAEDPGSGQASSTASRFADERPRSGMVSSTALIRAPSRSACATNSLRPARPASTAARSNAASAATGSPRSSDSLPRASSDSATRASSRQSELARRVAPPAQSSCSARVGDRPCRSGERQASERSDQRHRPALASTARAAASANAVRASLGSPAV